MKFNPLTEVLIYLASSTECAKPINCLATVKGLGHIDLHYNSANSSARFPYNVGMRYWAAVRLSFVVQSSSFKDVHLYF